MGGKRVGARRGRKPDARTGGERRGRPEDAGSGRATPRRGGRVFVRAGCIAHLQSERLRWGLILARGSTTRRFLRATAPFVRHRLEKEDGDSPWGRPVIFARGGRLRLVSGFPFPVAGARTHFGALEVRNHDEYLSNWLARLRLSRWRRTGLTSTSSSVHGACTSAMLRCARVNISLGRHAGESHAGCTEQTPRNEK